MSGRHAFSYEGSAPSNGAGVDCVGRCSCGQWAWLGSNTLKRGRARRAAAFASWWAHVEWEAKKDG